MKRNVNKMGNLWILLLVIILQAQSRDVYGQWQPETWIDEEISTEEEHLCHGLNTEDSRICKVVINNFLSLMFKSRNTEPQIIKSPGNHTRYIPIFIRMTNQEMERQEQNDLLINASRKEIEAQSRLEFALQRENELKSKLDLCNKESEVRLEMARKLQDQTDIKLKESQQKLNQFFVSELRLQLTLENLNNTLTKCEQARVELSSQLYTAITEATEAKIRLELNQENTNQTIKNCQMQLMEARSQLAIVKKNESWMRTQLQMFEETNVTKHLQDVEQNLNVCRNTGSQAEINRRGLVSELDECKQSVQNISLENINLQTLLNNKNAEISNCSIQKRLTPGSVTLETGVYYFIKTRMSWSDARDLCISKGMDLLSVESAEENLAIVRYALELGGRITSWAHTSGCYSNQARRFVWQSTKQPTGFTNWKVGQPDDLAESSCIQIKIEDGFWMDYKVDGQSEPAICELM